MFARGFVQLGRESIPVVEYFSERQDWFDGLLDGMQQKTKLPPCAARPPRLRASSPRGKMRARSARVSG